MFSEMDPQVQIAGEERILEFARVHGDSFYLFFPEILKKNVNSFSQAFRRHWQNTQVAYSYKTNYLPRLCSLVSKWGCLAEVVSGLEYQMAKSIGVPGHRVIFNGPYKRPDEMETALVDGAVVNLDSPYEVDLIRGIARRNQNRLLRVGIRAAFSVQGHGTRFGFDLQSGAFDDAVTQLRAIKNIKISGFHAHIMPPERSLSGYEFVIGTLLALYRQYSHSLSLEFLDVGGGFYSPMPTELVNQFDHHIPTIEEYGSAIGGKMRGVLGAGDHPCLILEPGLALVADTMVFAARVIDLKRVCNRGVALLSGSVYNVKPTRTRRNLPIRRVVSKGDGDFYEDIDFVGYTCMEDDILYKGYRGRVAVGDFILFGNVGAYVLPLKPPFIQPNVPVLSLEGNGCNVELVKDGESYNDILGSYRSSHENGLGISGK